MTEPANTDAPPDQITRSVIGDVHPTAAPWQIVGVLRDLVTELVDMTPGGRPDWSTLSIGVAFPATPTKPLVTLFAKVTDHA